MSSAKVYYFNMAGIGEPIRFCFHVSGQKFEDIRVKDWPALKPNTPLGSMPLLEINGKMYPQSFAIAKYVAKKTDLTPTDELDQLKVDSVLGTVQDFLGVLGPSFREKSTDKKLAMRKALLENQIPVTFGFFEKWLGENTTSSGFFLEKLSLADIFVRVIINMIHGGGVEGLPSSTLDAYPRLKTLLFKVNEEPRFAAFKALPENQFTPAAAPKPDGEKLRRETQLVRYTLLTSAVLFGVGVLMTRR